MDKFPIQDLTPYLTPYPADAGVLLGQLQIRNLSIFVGMDTGGRP